jgi:AAA family ATP:ADP antiporter
MPALFWSFVAGSMDTALAKRGYAIIMFFGQFGTVLGCFLDMHATTIGLQTLYFGATCGIFMIAPMVLWYTKKYPIVSTLADEQEKKKTTGLFEGLRLLATKPYLMGILGVATLYEAISAIVDYQMKTMANQVYPTAAGVAEFDAFYGVITNLLAMVFALVGTSFFLRVFGLRFSLIAYPVTVAVAICVMWRFHGLWVLMITMVIIKGISYALNNPCKEIMYIPTSKDVRFKAKSWIDVFGARTSKGAGAWVCALIPAVEDLMIYGSIISLGIVGVWIGAALYIGRTNHKLVQEGRIIS